MAVVRRCSEEKGFDVTKLLVSCVGESTNNTFAVNRLRE